MNDQTEVLQISTEEGYQGAGEPQISFSFVFALTRVAKEVVLGQLSNAS